jgi:2-C-methyl-D-erythritol 4-phosphate cytidylyltransferase
VSVWSIVLAAGSGARYDPVRLKQHERLGPWRVLDLALERSRSVAEGLVLVVRADLVDEPEPLANRVVAGGATRSASVRCGLAALPDECDVVVVHDAARPLAGAPLFHAVVDAVRAGADAAVPGVPVTDTIKQVDGARVVRTIEREALVSVQTPQAFVTDVLRQAHAVAGEATDDAALVEAIGGSVVIVPGDPGNLKITTPFDLAVAQLRLS